jgi:hypothetical protein
MQHQPLIITRLQLQCVLTLDDDDATLTTDHNQATNTCVLTLDDDDATLTTDHNQATTCVPTLEDDDATLTTGHTNNGTLLRQTQETTLKCSP